MLSGSSGAEGLDATTDGRTTEHPPGTSRRTSRNDMPMMIAKFAKIHSHCRLLHTKRYMHTNIISHAYIKPPNVHDPETRQKNACHVHAYQLCPCTPKRAEMKICEPNGRPRAPDNECASRTVDGGSVAAVIIVSHLPCTNFLCAIYCVLITVSPLNSIDFQWNS